MPRMEKSLRFWLGWTMMSLVLPAALGAQGWPQWRGPNRDGAAGAFTAPQSWPEKMQRVWQTAVGSGYSGPVTADGTIYLLSREGDEEVVRALRSSDGTSRWRQSYPAPFTPSRASSAHGPGPKSTPVLHGGRLYTLGIRGMLSSFDAQSGERLWQKDFSGEFKTPWPVCGAATSPLVAEGLLIAHVGGDHDGALTAFDAASGELRWRLAGDGPGYASPIVVELRGQRQVVTLTDSHLTGVDLGSGRLLWRLPYTTQWDQNIITPVAYGEKLILSGFQKSIQAFAVKREGEQWTPQESWGNAQASLFTSSPVVVGDRLFGISQKNKGQFFALEAATGKTLWISEGRQGGHATLITAGDLVFILSAEGELWILPADADDFAPVARYQVADSPTWAHPALVDRGILIRDRTSLALWSF